MKKYYLFLLAGLFSVLISCSTVKKTKEEIPVKSPEKESVKETVKPESIKKVSKYISLMASIEFIQNKAKNEFNTSINLNNDTLGIKVLGPFNVVVAELFSTNEIFYMIDKWNGVLYKGKPTKENFNHAMQLPISYQEITGLIRCNPYEDITRFTINPSTNSKSVGYYFADAISKDSLWFDKATKNIQSYKHISSVARESYSVHYEYGDTLAYPNKITFTSGGNKLTLKVDKFSLEKFKVKNIKIPDKVSTIDLDAKK